LEPDIAQFSDSNGTKNSFLTNMSVSRLRFSAPQVFHEALLKNCSALNGRLNKANSRTLQCLLYGGLSPLILQAGEGIYSGK